MAEYIEREKVHRLVRSLNRYAWSNPDRSEYRPTVDIDEVQFGIDKIPAADVVEVVRCKDCAVPHNRFTGCPKLNGLIPPENHFCSFGERKEGDEMTPKEAIGIVRCAIGEVEWNYPLDYSIAFKTAIEALEKQIPKKPVVVGEEYIFERDEWEKDYECPFCGNPYADDSFCSCCGQKIDWSDNNA